jgi:SAM-dependent methyltransferase
MELTQQGSTRRVDEAGARASVGEQAFFDAFWQATPLRRITERLEMPGVDLRGKRVLICSCGSGEEPVRAVNAGASAVYAFDISSTAVAKAREVARHNGVVIHAHVMDFHALAYPSDFFDVVYGSAILHHVDCARAGDEIRRCLKPGGLAYFCENSDRNPLLRWARRTLFGAPGDVQRRRAWVFKRYGTDDEYPLTDDELRALQRAFGSALRIRIPRFVFFEMLAVHGWRNDRFLRATQVADRLAVRLIPGIARYSFLQDVVLRKDADGSPARAEFPSDSWRLETA